MPLSLRDRFAFWLERRAPRLVLRYDRHTTHTLRPVYVNRINGHTVVR